MSNVKVWQEDVVLPTYEIGAAEKNPMFLEKRVYQGSSGVVYPYPVVEKIEDTPVDKVYKAVYLENEYIKVMILPELGGRVQMAYDKIKERHFVYYNHVVKPALVGLTGPWISGGIEFNWPQHHRPSTYLPIDFSIEELSDGGATIWVSERERMFHQKGMAGFTLRPGVALLEIQGKLYNPTPVPQTFLWWANPAVVVNDGYQSVFPPDVNAVFDHGKRDVSKFPIATGTYYKMDYSSGVDISRYKNIPVPTSYMAIRSDYNFVGGYENDIAAGLLHVANHHISPGKKQWTWGCGDFGVAWDRNLTDADGPYIELMTGVYTDNQPDFTWLQPYEEKTFTQYFMPYRELGVVKNANKDLLMNVEQIEGKTIVKVFATSKQTNIQLTLAGEKIYLQDTLNLSPEKVYEKELTHVPEDINSLTLTLCNAFGKPLLTWKGKPEEIDIIPDPAQPALAPRDVVTTEQLFLTGQHIEQYRHATYIATDYYEEALRRDPSDIRNNNAMGLWYLRKGQFALAEGYLRTAIKTQTQRNPNPYDGEPLYNLGLCLKAQGRYEEAYEAFYKACWNAAWQDAGYFSLAQISAMRGDWTEALHEIEKSLIRNYHNHIGRHLKVAILRHSEQWFEASKLIEESLKLDRFNFGCRFEQYLLTNESSTLEELTLLMRNDSHNYLEVALDYMNAGLYDEAIKLLTLSLDYCDTVSPMVYYYMSLAAEKKGEPAQALLYAETAAETCPDYCFPNRVEAIEALHHALEINPTDAKAYYYLGNLWYDKRQYKEAIAAWETSVKLDGQFPTSHRNLALAYFNKLEKTEEALALLEKAFSLDTSDTRLLMELDQLYKRLNVSHEQRLAFLYTYKTQVSERDDLYLEYATLLNQLERYAEAQTLIDARQFHPWEGGEGKVPAQFQIARVEQAKLALRSQQYEQALALLSECFTYPHHLGEGKLHGAQENDFNYYLGCAYEGLGKQDQAQQCFLLASEGLSEPTDAMYYNDQKPDKIFYQGLALLKLNRDAEARSRFNKLISYGEKHIYDQVSIDYFAVSLPDLLIWEDDLNRRNRIHCLYMMGLGTLGLMQGEKAKTLLSEALSLDNNHQGVQIHLSLAETNLI